MVRVVVVFRSGHSIVLPMIVGSMVVLRMVAVCMSLFMTVLLVAMLFVVGPLRDPAQRVFQRSARRRQLQRRARGWGRHEPQPPGQHVPRGAKLQRPWRVKFVRLCAARTKHNAAYTW